MKFAISPLRYIISALFLAFFALSFALSPSDIVTQIQSKMANERLLKETKTLIMEGGTIVPSMEKSEIFQKLQEMSNYSTRRQRTVPPVIEYLMSQKEQIISSSNIIVDSAVEIYTTDKYARFLWTKKQEEKERQLSHEAALKFLPEGVQVPTPKASDTYQSILVDLSEQRIYAFEEGVLVGVSPVTTGKRGFPTIRGDFKVLKKQTDRRLVSPFKDQYYNLHVDYWIQFYKGFGIHDACNSKSCWRKEFGGPDYVTRGSHGCVNTPYEFVAWMYGWVLPGTRVSVVS